MGKGHRRHVVSIIILILLEGLTFLVAREQVQHPSPSTPPPKVAPPTEVHYDGSKLSPAALTVKAGTTVNFISDNGFPMQLTSRSLPEFSQPNSTFIYSFTFKKVGQWGYYNLAFPKVSGLVNVTP